MSESKRIEQRALPADRNAMGVASIAAKKAKVILATDHVAKDGYNEHQRYAYPTESAYLDAVRKPMAEAGLALSFTEHECTLEQFGTTSNNNPKYLTQLDVEVTLTCCDTGHQESSIVSGWAMDTEDKGKRKALSAAIKDYISKTFMLPAEDDPEHGPRSSAPPASGAQRRSNGRTRRSSKPKKQQLSDEAKETLGKVQKLGLELYGKDWPSKRAEFVQHFGAKRIEEMKSDQLEGLHAQLSEMKGEEELSPSDQSRELFDTADKKAEKSTS